VLCEQSERHRIKSCDGLTAFGPRPCGTLAVPAIGFEFSGTYGFGATHDAWKLPVDDGVPPHRNTSVKSYCFEAASNCVLYHLQIPHNGTGNPNSVQIAAMCDNLTFPRCSVAVDPRRFSLPVI
jgi:hypothetical protein